MTVRVTYNGGMDEVAVLCPSGATYRVKRGGTVDMMPTDAATLSTTEWSGKGVGSAFDTPPEDTGTSTPALLDTTAEEN